MEILEKKEIGTVSAVLSSLCFLAGFLIFYFGNVSVASGVEMFTGFFGFAFSEASVNMEPFVNFSLGMVLLTAGLAFASVIGLYYDDWRLPLVASGVPALIALFLFNFSTAAFLLSLGMIVFSVRNTIMSYARYQELEKFSEYRVGSNTVGKALVWVILLLALGLFLSIASNPRHEEVFTQEFEGVIIDMAKENMMSKCMETANQQYCQALVDQVDEEQLGIGELPIMSQVGKLLPFLLVLSFVGTMSFLKLFLSIVAGLTTLLMIKIFSTSPAGTRRRG